MCTGSKEQREGDGEKLKGMVYQNMQQSKETQRRSGRGMGDAGVRLYLIDTRGPEMSTSGQERRNK